MSPAAARPRPLPGWGLLFSLALFLVSLEAASAAGLAILRLRGITYQPITDSLTTKHAGILRDFISGRPSYFRVDPDLGWSLTPLGDFRGLYHAGPQGMRGSRVYPVARTPGVLRVVAMGESFTHGDEVHDDESWPSQLEAIAGAEVLNFGIGGYALDQALLRYRRDARRFNAEVVLIGYMSENIRRAVNVYRPFYDPEAGLPLSKPRFRLGPAGLSLVPNPLSTLASYQALLDRPDLVLRELGTHDHYWHRRPHGSGWDALRTVRLGKLLAYQLAQDDPYDPAGEPFQVTVATFDEFAMAVRADGAEPVMLLFPGLVDLPTPTYRALHDTLTARGHRVLDLIEVFRECGACAESFQRFGHYSPAGNRKVARHLAGHLEDARKRAASRR